MLHLAQKNSRERFEGAREAIGTAKMRGYDKRAEARKHALVEEQAGRAGVITIDQAEATYIDLNIWAYDTFGASFYEFANLNFGQAAVYKTRTVYPIGVAVGNLAGGPPNRLFATAQNAVQVQPFQYFSDEFLVPNLVNANFNLEMFKEREKALERVAHDIRLFRQQILVAQMLGQPLTTPLATAVTNYGSLSSSPYNGRTVYVADSQIVSGSLPTTNIIDDHTEAGLTKNVFRDIRTFCIEAQREARSLFIPVAGSPWQAYWAQASIVGYQSGISTSNYDTSKAIPPTKWEQAVEMSFERNGAYMKWFDMELFVQPLNVLPADYAVFSTSEPAGLGWDQMSAAVTDEESIYGQRAMSRRYEARSIALAQPDPFLLNFGVVKINTL